MPKVKVIYNRAGCIGAGACEVAAPEFWKMAKDGKVDLLGSKFNPKIGKYELEIEVSEEQLRALKESAESCPVQVIEIIELQE